MKLYLSSIGIPNEKELLALVDDMAKTVALINNAGDNYPTDVHEAETKAKIQLFKDLGFTVTLVDLRNYNEGSLETELSQHSLIWVSGGNTFYLNELFKKSGMNRVLPRVIKNGAVYGGESAGAVIVCPTLHGVELLDDPSEATEIIWNGLGLVDFGIVPHWDNETYAEPLKKCKIEMEKYTSVTTLLDSQAIVIKNRKSKIISLLQ